MILSLPQTQKENELLCNWLEKRLDGASYSGYQTMAFFDPAKGKVHGVVLYHNYRDTDIEIVFAGEGLWARRSLIKLALRYPFDQLRCNRITALVRKDNTKSRRMVELIGFRREGKLRAANTDRSDLLVYGLLPSDLRLYYTPKVKRQEHGKVNTKAA